MTPTSASRRAFRHRASRKAVIDDQYVAYKHSDD